MWAVKNILDHKNNNQKFSPNVSFIYFLGSNPSYPIGSLYTQPQLSTLTLTDTLSLLNSAALPVSTIDTNTALTFGSKRPSNVTLPQCAKVLSGSPIQIILNSSPTPILSSLNSIDFVNLGTAQFSTLANVVR